MRNLPGSRRRIVPSRPHSRFPTRLVSSGGISASFRTVSSRCPKGYSVPPRTVKLDHFSSSNGVRLLSGVSPLAIQASGDCKTSFGGDASPFCSLARTKPQKLSGSCKSRLFSSESESFVVLCAESELFGRAASTSSAGTIQPLPRLRLDQFVQSIPGGFRRRVAGAPTDLQVPNYCPAAVPLNPLEQFAPWALVFRFAQEGGDALGLCGKPLDYGDASSSGCLDAPVSGRRNNQDCRKRWRRGRDCAER